MAPTDELIESGLNPALDKLNELYAGLLASLPLIAIAVVIGAIGTALAVAVAQAVQRGLSRGAADPTAARMLARIVRAVGVLAVVLVVLSIVGVEVGPAVAGLGLAGLGLAFALQGILENFFAGLILLVRKPFRSGDQIRTNDFEGTVADVDLRVTKIIDYDGELILIPNAQVYGAPLTNLTRRGQRRSCVRIGVDYRDDHDAAREVIRAAVGVTEGVQAQPPPEVLLTELGESSVNFDVRYWTAPDITSVRQTQDRVLSAAKRAIEDAGMTIPWPVRTVLFGDPLRIDSAASTPASRPA